MLTMTSSIIFVLNKILYLLNFFTHVYYMYYIHKCIKYKKNYEKYLKMVCTISISVNHSEIIEPILMK